MFRFSYFFSSTSSYLDITSWETSSLHLPNTLRILLAKVKNFGLIFAPVILWVTPFILFLEGSYFMHSIAHLSSYFFLLSLLLSAFSLEPILFSLTFFSFLFIFLRMFLLASASFIFLVIVNIIECSPLSVFI